MNIIKVDPILFRELFVEFKDATDNMIEFSSEGAGAYISRKPGSVSGWDVKTQTRALYLCTAHLLYLRNNGGGLNKNISSAGEGSDSVSFHNAKNGTEYFFGLSTYGIELLTLLEMISPPLSQKPYNDNYY
jgi:hypothetical protein